MNISLMCKWLWRLKDPLISGWWKSLLLLKYQHSTNKKKWSPFWKSIQAFDQIIEINKFTKIGNGVNTKFWLDKWCGDVPFSILYHSLFQICSNQQISVAAACSKGMLDIQFKRNLTQVHRIQFSHLIQQITPVLPLADKPDEILWQGQNCNKLKNIEIYKWLMFRGTVDHSKNLIWLLKIPHKIKIFLWLLSKRKILVRTNLVRKGWQGDTHCVYCTQLETVDHLFLQCNHVHQLWAMILPFFDINGLPRHLEDVGNILLQLESKQRNLLGLICAALFWTCWLERNHCCFSQSRPISIQAYKAKIFVLLMYWAGAWEAEMKAEMDRVLTAVGFKVDILVNTSPLLRPSAASKAQEYMAASGSNQGRWSEKMKSAIWSMNPLLDTLPAPLMSLPARRMNGENSVRSIVELPMLECLGGMGV